MDYKITRDVQSWGEVVPMLNKVFKKNFYKLLPKIYGGDRFMHDHFIIRDGGKIVANVTSAPIMLKSGDATLNGRGIGMVAVRKSHRCKRLMNGLMTKVVATAREEGADFMFLGGNRKRYERFGFVPCATTAQFMLCKENIKHSTCQTELSFVSLNQDSEYLPKVEALYNSQNTRYERQDFYKTMQSWKAKKFFAILKDSEVVGHIIVQYTSIIELNVVGVSAKDVAINYYNKIHKLPILRITAYPNRLDILDSLASICQRYSSESPSMINILNYKSVVCKLLSAQKPCASYDFVLEIEDDCRLKISARDGIFTVEDCKDKADIILPKDMASVILMSPQLSVAHGLPFFLNLYITTQDNV